jgi:hypothetical protein
MGETIIALAPSVYSGINIQSILIKQGKNSYIKSVNIIYKKRIIKKIKLYGVRKRYSHENVDAIASSYFNKILESINTTKQEVNKEAKKRAASDLMNEFNI